ncbi:hypothetical protein D7V93_02785 [Corallococcus llansteffanensis]|uniref:Uncharacterized protein n=1 Tax=Corallococcus llansteffanensis TaxID=2316731 RepID=A0A3A8QRW1_9BACT|nr:hypothetical protein D7V93_02785 [Corallococcus llansteffanensis]
MAGRSAVLALFGVLLCQVLAAGLSALDVVPSWQSTRVGLVLGLVVLSWVLALAVRVPWARQTWSKVLLRLMLAALLLAGGWFSTFSALTAEGFAVGGRELVRTTMLGASAGELYTYEYSGVPDGFEGSALMVRQGWLPVMRRLLTTPSRIQDVQQVGDTLRVELEPSSGGASPQVVHCQISSRTCN